MFWIARRALYAGRKPFKNWREHHKALWWLMQLTFWVCITYIAFRLLWWNLSYIRDTTPCQRHGDC